MLVRNIDFKPLCSYPIHSISILKIDLANVDILKGWFQGYCTLVVNANC